MVQTAIRRAISGGPPALRVFVVALAVQGFHMLEHVIQLVQLYVLDLPEGHGLAGAAVDQEWVHFAYNSALFATLLGVIVLAGPAQRKRWIVERRVGWALLVAVAVAQGYHFVEHSARFYQYVVQGVAAPAGLIGQAFDVIVFHAVLNGVVYSLMIAAFAALVIRRRPA